MTLDAGKLNHFVAIERITGARDQSGAETNTWSTWAQVWAHLEPFTDSARSGKEEFADFSVQSIVYTRVHIRYLPGITPKDRVNYNGRLFDILAVNNRDEGNFEMELICKERQ